MPKRNEAELIIFVLAGGRSSRMGRDKSRLLLGGKSFLQRIIETARHLEAPVEVITEDEIPKLGPFGGIMTAFSRFQFKRALFLSCDTPLITSDFLRRLVAAAPNRATFAATKGRLGFPFLLPRAAGSILPALRRREMFSVQEVAAAANGVSFGVSEGEEAELFNINTPEDYQRIQKLWLSRENRDVVLEVRHLTVQRGENRLVSNFSWLIRKREHWAVLGANGCGKTSLFSSLLGYLTPTRGDIFVLGEEYGDADWPALRKKIGMVSSSLRQMLAESEPAWITVASGRYAMIDFWGTPGEKDRKDSLDLLRKMECEKIAERSWAQLSQGERQRVLIARALIANPALLILDEPCAGLDPAAREHFLAFLERLGRRRDCPAIVLVTHHVEEVMPFFTHVLLMKKGEKLAEGTVREMLVSTRLKETFDTPMQIRKERGRYSLRVTPKPGAIA